MVIIYFCAYKPNNLYNFIINETSMMCEWINCLFVFNELHTALAILFLITSHANKVNEMSTIELRDLACAH